MTQPFDDEYGDRLRRALHAEADAVTPSPEGLERIRSKVNQRHERRLGFISYSTPWLRPLAAVTAALAVCFAAVSVTPALANFVQTGHFSPESGTDDNGNAANDGRSYGQVVPGQSSTPTTGGTPTPTPSPSSTPGAHVTCPPGQVTVSPSPGSVRTAWATCRPLPPGGTTGGGNDTTSAPPTEPPPPPPTSTPPDDPTEDPGPGAGAGSQPAVDIPNQSP